MIGSLRSRAFAPLLRTSNAVPAASTHTLSTKRQPTRACSSATCTHTSAAQSTTPASSATPLRTFSSSPSSLPSTMRAQVLTKLHAKDFVIGEETLKMPQPKQNEVLIKVRASGVCHTDLHVMKDEVKFPIPAVMGHELSGTIVKLGENLDPISQQKLAVGQRVIAPFIMPCGGCYYCIRGKEDICETFFNLNRLKGQLYDGTTRLYREDDTPIAMYSMGALAEYCIVPATSVFPLPDSIPFAESSIVGCAIFTAYGAVRHGADLRGGENIAVIGAGGVGANVLQFARAFGANKIIAVDISDDKLKSMIPLGATHTVNALKHNAGDRIKEITNGRGVDVCIEALGRKDTFIQAVNAVADGGRAVMVGIAPAGVTADVEITKVVRRSIRIVGSYGAKARQDIPTILSMIEKGAIDVTSPISKRYSFKDAAQAYKDLNAGKITGRAIVDMEA